MKKLLIVDDDPDFSGLLKSVIHMHAVDVDTCGDGREAIRMAKKNKYDVIILDYKLPNFTGLEIVEALRKENINPPTIMITGYSDEVMRSRARELDVTAFLEKPFDLRVLDFYVEKFLHAR